MLKKQRYEELKNALKTIAWWNKTELDFDAYSFIEKPKSLGNRNRTDKAKNVL